MMFIAIAIFIYAMAFENFWLYILSGSMFFHIGVSNMMRVFPVLCNKCKTALHEEI